MLARNLWMAVVLAVLSCAARGAAQEAAVGGEYEPAHR